MRIQKSFISVGCAFVVCFLLGCSDDDNQLNLRASKKNEEQAPQVLAGSVAEKKTKIPEDDEKSSELAELLYDQATLSAGEQLENPSLFVKRLNQLLFERSS